MIPMRCPRERCDAHTGDARSRAPCRGRDGRARMLEEMLERSGYDVGECGDRRAGPLLASERTFDLLLTDIDLPGINGAQLSAALHERFPTLAWS